MRFTTTLLLHGKTATGMEVPADVLESLGGGKRHAVSVTINGYTYRSTTASMGGKVLLPVSAEVRAGAGIAAGDDIDVLIEADSAPREVVVPDDLAVALEGVRDAFDALSFTKRKEAVRSVEDAKTDATRQRRIEKVVSSLS